MKLYYGIEIRRNKIRSTISKIQDNTELDLEENSIVTPKKSYIGKKKESGYCCCGSCIV